MSTENKWIMEAQGGKQSDLWVGDTSSDNEATQARGFSRIVLQKQH